MRMLLPIGRSRGVASQADPADAASSGRWPDLTKIPGGRHWRPERMARTQRGERALAEHPEPESHFRREP